MTGTELKSILDRAGIKPVEASQVLQIAKSTLYHWFNEENKPKQEAVIKNTNEICKRIVYATARGWLPISEDAQGKERMSLIRVALNNAGRSLRGFE